MSPFKPSLTPPPYLFCILAFSSIVKPFLHHLFLRLLQCHFLKKLPVAMPSPNIVLFLCFLCYCPHLRCLFLRLLQCPFPIAFSLAIPPISSPHMKSPFETSPKNPPCHDLFHNSSCFIEPPAISPFETSLRPSSCQISFCYASCWDAPPLLSAMLSVATPLVTSHFETSPSPPGLDILFHDTFYCVVLHSTI